MFALAKKIKAPLKWIESVKDAYLLMSEIEDMCHCAHAIKAIFEVKKFYSWEYFELTDYMIAYPFGANQMNKFLELVQYQNLVARPPWVALFKQYVSL